MLEEPLEDGGARQASDSDEDQAMEDQQAVAEGRR